MANIAATDNWADVYQWADGDVLDGGPESLEVLPIKQLANRTLYQRLRNVTTWSDVLAAAHGYPAGACVMHLGLSWRAKVANDVAPGSDVTKWERWGFSEEELDAKLAAFLPYAAPTVCPNTGPDGAAAKAKIQKSALGEYWMWLGDAWKVVAGLYTGVNAIASNNIAANVQTGIVSITAPRNGVAVVRGIFSGLNSAGAMTVMTASVRRTRAGVTTDVSDAYAVSMTTVAGQYAQARPFAMAAVEAGDVYLLSGLVTQPINASPLNASSIYLEYQQ